MNYELIAQFDFDILGIDLCINVYWEKFKNIGIDINLREKNAETHAKERVSRALGSIFTSLTHYQEKTQVQWM